VEHSLLCGSNQTVVLGRYCFKCVTEVSVSSVPGAVIDLYKLVNATDSGFEITDWQKRVLVMLCGLFIQHGRDTCTVFQQVRLCTGLFIPFCFL
jgi:hypothetical protein